MEYIIHVTRTKYYYNNVMLLLQLALHRDCRVPVHL